MFGNVEIYANTIQYNTIPYRPRVKFAIVCNLRIGQQVSSPTQYFWYRTTLMISKDINTPEVFNWKIALALVIAWILVYMCMIKGITSSGKV